MTDIDNLLSSSRTTWQAQAQLRRAKSDNNAVDDDAGEPDYSENYNRAGSTSHLSNPTPNNVNNFASLHENWLENEVQPTDSEIESIYKENNDENTLKNNFDSCNEDTTEDYSRSSSASNKWEKSPKMGVIDLSKPMTKEELMATMEVLKELYRKNFGSDMPLSSTSENSSVASVPDLSTPCWYKIDADINQIKAKLAKLSAEQEKLKSIAQVINTPIHLRKSMADIPVETYISNKNDTRRSTLSPSVLEKGRSSLELTSPTLSVFMEEHSKQDQMKQFNDLEEKARIKEKLMIKQLQRRENLLQRRIQREAERALVHEEERRQEELLNQWRAENRARREFILQSHKQSKDQSLSGSRFDLKRPTKGKRDTLSFDDLTLDELYSYDNDKELSGRRRYQRKKNSSFMSTTTSFQGKMNRAASMNSVTSGIESEAQSPLMDIRGRLGGGSLLNLHSYRDASEGVLHKRASVHEINLTDALTPALNRLRTSRTLGKGSQKSNRNYMTNALIQVALAGHANRKQREAAIQEMEASSARHFMILFRDHRLQYRGLYTYINEADTVEKIHGIGPAGVTESMVEKFYKYNSGNKSFMFIPAKHFSIQCDAFIIQDEYWHKRSLSTNRRKNV